MKVYVLEIIQDWNGEERYVGGVYTSRDLAEDAADKATFAGAFDADITECEVQE